MLFFLYVPSEKILEIKTEIEVDEHTLTFNDEPSTHISEVFIKEEPKDTTEYNGFEPATNITNRKLENYPTQKKHAVEKLMISHPEKFCECVGLANIETFQEIYEYIKDDLTEIDDIPKITQLFTTLVKLHLNIDNFHVDPHKFPAIYVPVVERLFHNFQFMWRLKLPLLPAPSCVKNLFPVFSEHLVILHVLELKIKSAVTNPTQTVNYLIGYTNFGHVFYISKAFRSISSYVQFAETSGLLTMLNKYSAYIFEVGGMLYSCSVQSKVPKLIQDEEMARYFDGITRRLVDRFVVLSGAFPEFMLGDTGNNSFLDRLVMVCCSLLNIDSFRMLDGNCAD